MDIHVALPNGHRGVTLDQHHSSHIAGLQLRVIRARGGGATLCSYQTITLELRRKLA